MTTANLNGIRVISARIFVPETRVWFVDLDLDPDDVKDAPTSGKATLVIGAETFVGTIDPRGSSGFVASAGVRFVGGAAAWDAPVPPKDFSSPSGVRSVDVYTETAAEVGETVNDPAPLIFAQHFPRMAGPASRVFRWRDWYVDFQGVTQVGLRPPSTPDPSFEILGFDPVELVGTASSDVLLVPGTVIADPRFAQGSVVVRDVEQEWKPNGIRVKFWVAASAGSRLRSSVQQFAREAVDFEHLRPARYRCVATNGDNTLQLQAITPGAPDLNPVSQWSGLSGTIARLQPSTEIVIGWTGDDPPQPYVASYLPGFLPQLQKLDAQTMKIGESGETLIGAAPEPIVLAPPLQVILGLLETASAALNTWITAQAPGPVSITGPQQGAISGALGALVAALTPLEIAAIQTQTTEAT